MSKINVYDEISRNKRRTVFLMLGFILLLTAFGYLFDYFLSASGSIIISTLIFASIWTLISYFLSTRFVLLINGAKKADENEYRYLINTVEGLSIAAGIKPPQVYIIETPAMNAFATGRNPENSYVVFTTGLLKNLNRQEIEGVAAHEIAHIANQDIKIQTIAAMLAGFFVMIVDIIYRILFYSLFFSPNSQFDVDGESEDRNDFSKILILLIVFLASLIAAVFAELIKLAISREREYLADATGALLTRNPEGLASALEKIANLSPPFERANSATAHLFIYPPLGLRTVRSFLSRLLSTHPPIEERIKRLRSM
ncbi:MAG: M48 family metalloprotease [Actinobacteria bacterium]|nr:M48 family metalloprotease [Actinomycetota bacterium]